MLFKPEHVPMIQSGRKTETRRIWKSCHVKVGKLYRIKTQMISKNFDGFIFIKKVWQESLDDITEAGAIAEGYKNRAEYFDIFNKINGDTPLWTVVWCIQFEYVSKGVYFNG